MAQHYQIDQWLLDARNDNGELRAALRKLVEASKNSVNVYSNMHGDPTPTFVKLAAAIAETERLLGDYK